METRALRVTLRVLAALVERIAPDEADLAELRSYAPYAANLSPDELACAVIQKVEKARIEERRNGERASEALTPRQLEVLRLIALGRTTKLVAAGH